MSNLSEGLIQQGMLIERTNIAFNMIKNGFSKEEAFRILNIDENTKQLVLEKLQEENNI